MVFEKNMTFADQNFKKIEKYHEKKSYQVPLNLNIKLMI